MRSRYRFKALFLFILLGFQLSLPLSSEAKTQQLTVDLSLSTTDELTSSFVSYLNLLFELQILDQSDLRLFIEALKNETLINPLRHGKSFSDFYFMNPASEIHFNQVEQYLESNQLDTKTLLSWADSKIQELEKNKNSREAVQEETQVAFYRMDFLPVLPGKFKYEESLRWGDKPDVLEHVIRKGFEFMSTPVTQYQWAKVMGTNPSRFKAGKDSLVFASHGKTIQIRPNAPVENVSWDDSKSFLKELNRLARENPQLLAQLISSTGSSHYRYRLPTAEEWEYVAKNQGISKGKWFFGDDPNLFNENGWLSFNSQNTTHDVAELKPFLVNGNSFYDIYGNVQIWTESCDTFRGVYLTKGCSWNDSYAFCESFYGRFLGDSQSTSSEIGLRLVRVEAGGQP